MIVPEYTFRPMTRSAMALERLAAESGRPVAAILSHVGACPYRLAMLRMCRSLMFNRWEILNEDTGQWEDDPRGAAENWLKFSEWLLVDFGQHTTCPNCDRPCHPRKCWSRQS